MREGYNSSTEILEGMMVQGHLRSNTIASESVGMDVSKSIPNLPAARVVMDTCALFDPNLVGGFGGYGTLGKLEATMGGFNQWRRSQGINSSGEVILSNPICGDASYRTKVESFSEGYTKTYTSFWEFDTTVKRLLHKVTTTSSGDVVSFGYSIRPNSASTSTIFKNGNENAGSVTLSNTASKSDITGLVSQIGSLPVDELPLGDNNLYTSLHGGGDGFNFYASTHKVGFRFEPSGSFSQNSISYWTGKFTSSRNGSVRVAIPAFVGTPHGSYVKDAPNPDIIDTSGGHLLDKGYNFGTKREELLDLIGDDDTYRDLIRLRLRTVGTFNQSNAESRTEWEFDLPTHLGEPDTSKSILANLGRLNMRLPEVFNKVRIRSNTGIRYRVEVIAYERFSTNKFSETITMDQSGEAFYQLNMPQDIKNVAYGKVEAYIDNVWIEIPTSGLLLASGRVDVGLWRESYKARQGSLWGYSENFGSSGYDSSKRYIRKRVTYSVSLEPYVNSGSGNTTVVCPQPTSTLTSVVVNSYEHQVYDQNKYGNPHAVEESSIKNFSLNGVEWTTEPIYYGEVPFSPLLSGNFIISTLTPTLSVSNIDERGSPSFASIEAFLGSDTYYNYGNYGKVINRYESSPMIPSYNGTAWITNSESVGLPASGSMDVTEYYVSRRTDII